MAEFLLKNKINIKDLFLLYFNLKDLWNQKKLIAKLAFNY